MFGSSAINVVISLLFVFLIYSLLATALQEALAAIFKSRGSMLYKGIKSMLTDTNLKQSKIESWYENSIEGSIESIADWFISLFCETVPKTLYDLFYHHPIIKNYSENASTSKPSYLTAENFSTVLLDTIKNLNSENETSAVTFDIIKNNTLNYSVIPDSLAAQLRVNNNNDKIIPCETFRILLNYLNASGGDLNVFRSKLEVWYNDSMDRVSGWYKKQTQVQLFFLGLILAVGLNIDTIKIASQLSKDKVLSEKLADMGASVANNPAYKDSRLPDKILSEISKQKDTVNSALGLGWGYLAKGKEVDYQFYLCAVPKEIGFSSAFGFFLTAMAISLGAPFWFDLLNKFINLRTAGKAVSSSGPAINKLSIESEIDG